MIYEFAISYCKFVACMLCYKLLLKQAVTCVCVCSTSKTKDVPVQQFLGKFILFINEQCWAGYLINVVSQATRYSIE